MSVTRRRPGDSKVWFLSGFATGLSFSECQHVALITDLISLPNV